jgi:predicted outer membrane protein
MTSPILAAADRTFLMKAAEGGKAEVELAEFQHVASQSTDPDIKAFASKTLPTLQDHLRQAEAAAKK